MSMAATATPMIRTLVRRDLTEAVPRIEGLLLRHGVVPLSRHPFWLAVLEDGLGHRGLLLEAFEGEETRGFLALAYIHTPWFGRFLVSLPYLNYGGAVTADERVAGALVDQAIALANEKKVRHLELRNQKRLEHPGLTGREGAKVNMRLILPPTIEQLWSTLSPKVRNQVRKGIKGGLEARWGGTDCLDDFYDVFSRNMRDLGTPVYGKGFFAAILRHFPDRAEFCVVRTGDRPVAAALLLHGWGVTEVPSASSLRECNNTCANMMMYNCLLERAVGRGQGVFDFGRSSPDSGTYQFKKQWGAEPDVTDWQYYIRSGSAGDMRPENPRYQRMIRIWQRLPLGLTRLVGPAIVRGIP